MRGRAARANDRKQPAISNSRQPSGAPLSKPSISMRSGLRKLSNGGILNITLVLRSDVIFKETPFECFRVPFRVEIDDFQREALDETLT